MSKSAQRYQPTSRAMIRESLSAREMAELARELGAVATRVRVSR